MHELPVAATRFRPLVSPQGETKIRAWRAGIVAVAPLGDGKRVAFWRHVNTEKQSKLVVFELDAGKERVLATVTDPESYQGGPSWSPDGRYIVFDGGRYTAPDKDGTPVIVEVKRTSISPSAVYQLEAYLIDFRKKNNDTAVRGILCAPRVSELAKTLIEEKGLEYRRVEWDFELSDKKQRSLDAF